MTTAATPSANPPPTALSRFLRPWRFLALMLAMVGTAMAAVPVATVTVDSTGSRSGALVSSSGTVTYTVTWDRDVVPVYLNTARLGTVTLASVFDVFDTSATVGAGKTISFRQVNGRIFKVIIGGLVHDDVASLALVANKVADASVADTSQAGDQNAGTAAIPVTVLLTVPVTLAITTADYTGFLDRPTMIGTFDPAAANYVVSVEADGGGAPATETVSTIGGGAWVYTQTDAPTIGVHQYIATAKDAAGNVGSGATDTGNFYIWSQPTIAHIDQTTPGTPVAFTDAMSVNNLKPGMDGLAGLPKALTGAGVVQVTVDIYLTGTTNPAISRITKSGASIVADAPNSATWSIAAADYSADLISGTTYDAVITLSVITTNPSTNTISTTKTFTVNAAAATVPTLAVTSPTPKHLPPVTIGVVTPTTATIVVTDAAHGDAVIAGTVTGTGPYIWTPNAAIPDGTYSLQATWTNAAGVVSAKSTAVPLVITTPTPVLAPGANAVAGGAKADGNVQYLGTSLTPQIAVTGVIPANGTLTMYRIPRTTTPVVITPYTISYTSVNGVVTNNDCTAGNVVVPGTFTGTDGTDGVWTASTVGADAFADLTAYSLVAKWTDNLLANGTDTATHTNAVSVASNVFNLRVVSDVSPPEIAEVRPADGTGLDLYSGSPLTLSYGAVQLKGTGNAGATLKLYNNGQSLPTITIPATGLWTYTFSSTGNAADLGEGVNSLTAKQLDLCSAADSVATPTPVLITVDTVAPGVPSILTPATGLKTADTTPTFTGIALANSTVKLYDGGVTLVATTTATSTGSWTVDASALASGAEPGTAHSITATATSTAGLTSAASTAVVVNIVNPALKVRLEPIAKGAGSGYLINKAAGYAANSTVIAIDTGTERILKGDVVNFVHAAGSDDTYNYTVVTYVPVSGVAGAGTITITPGLKASRVDNEAMSIVANPKGPVSKANGNTFPSSLSQILLTATFSDGADLAVDEILTSSFNASKVTVTNGTVTSVTKGTGLAGLQPTNVWTIAITPATSGTLSASIAAGAIQTTPLNIVTALTVSTAGSNYVGQPTISITGGTAATATLAEDGDGVIEQAEVTLTNSGYGFVGTPVVKVNPAPGAGATGTAVRAASGASAITSITVTNKGTGWTVGVAPKVLVTDTGGGSGGTFTAVMEQIGTTAVYRVASVTVGGTPINYTSATKVTFTNGSGAVITPTTVVGTVTFNTASTSHITGDAPIVLTAPLDPATVGTGAAYTLDLDRTKPTVTWSWAADTTAQLKPTLGSAGLAITGSSYVKLESPAANTHFKVRAHFSSVMSRAVVAGDLTATGCSVTSVTDVGGLHQDFDILLTRGASTAASMNVTVKAMANLYDTSVPALLNTASSAFSATIIPDPVAPVIDSLTNRATYLIPARTASYPCTVTFVAPVSSFGPDNLTVTNGVITKWAGKLPGKVFSFTLTPGEGQVSVQYNSASAYNTAHPLTDVAGTTIPSSNTFTRILDSTQPVIVAVSSPLFNKIGSGATATATLTSLAGAGGTAGAITRANGILTAIAVGNNGTTAYTYAPSVSFSGGGGTGATAHTTIDGLGEITAIVIDNGGSGYTSDPTVTITPASPVLSVAVGGGAGAGTGYAVAPVVTFTGGGGSGAAATAAIDADGKLTGITVTSGGTGYTSVPTVVINNSVRPVNNDVATNRFPVRVTFSEAPKTFPLASLVASLSSTGVAISLSAPTGSAVGAVGPQVVVGSGGKIWAFDLVTASAVAGADTIKLVVPALGVTDNATNQSAASQVYPITYDMVNGASVETVNSPVYSDG